MSYTTDEIELDFSWYGADLNLSGFSNCRCIPSFKIEEDSMDKAKKKEILFKENAAKHLKSLGSDVYRDLGFSNCKIGLGTRYMDEFARRRLQGKVGPLENMAIAVLAEMKDTDWYKQAKKSELYPEDPKPQAKLILDECGVKTYEVESITEDLSDDYTGLLEEAKTLHVGKKPVSGGVHFRVTSDDLSGAYYTPEHDTAKQLLESLGYEVTE